LGLHWVDVEYNLATPVRPRTNCQPKKSRCTAGRLPYWTGSGSKRDAQELVDLSASVRTDIEHANQGLLSKDVVEKLKRVENLSKHLRSELMR